MEKHAFNHVASKHRGFCFARAGQLRPGACAKVRTAFDMALALVYLPVKSP